ncbi:MAG: cupin domain-containing protein [Bdellovibrionota bacterium]
MTKEEVIAKLNLIPLEIEGGFFRETYKSKDIVQGRLGTRSEGTAIYYMVTEESFSALHIVDQDEIFHFYSGDEVEMFQILPDGTPKTIIIGKVENGHEPQVIVPRGVWQGTKLRTPGKGKWALLGCTVAPGFEYENFTLKSRDELVQLYPQHKDQIIRFTT